jgi:Fic family protein
MAYKPLFNITPHLLKLLEEIAVFREKIVTAAIQVPWIPSLQKDARARNSHSSTAIEGNPLTLAEVRLLGEGKTVSTSTERATREILNYFAGLRYVEKHANKKTIVHEDLFELHSLISTGVMDQGQAGRYGTFQVRVGSHLPPAAAQVSGLMRELLEWWNKEAHQLSPVITSGIIHYRFEAIHPFGDGNGRTGRMLALWELYRRGFDNHHIFSVDEVYWEKRPLYYKNLDLVRKEEDDLTGWLEYTAEVVHLTLERVWERIQRLKGETGAGKILLTPKQERLLGLLRDQHSLSPQEIWDGLGVTKQGAMKIMNPLIQAGLMKRTGSKKTGKYILTDAEKK